MTELDGSNLKNGSSHATHAPIACAYCHLPVVGTGASGKTVYCCLGCRLAAQITARSGEPAVARGPLLRLGLAVFLSINVMMFTMALWTTDVYGEAPTDNGALAAALSDLFRYMCLVLSVPVLFLLGIPLVENAINARREVAAADLLIFLGVTASFAYSAISLFRGAGHVYFEVGCAVLIAVTFGRWLEAVGKLQTSQALDALEKLMPSEARVICDGHEQIKPLDALRVGDHLRVTEGERFATDGQIVHGHAHVDEQLLTGESRLAVKRAGDSVLGGSLNADGDVLVEITKPADAGSLARLIELVRHSRESKGRYQRFADRVSAYFLSGIIALAITVLIGHTWLGDFEQGLMAGLAVLLIACPCALGIATPLVVWNALAAASRAGVLFRNGEALEKLARIRAVRFDKTGTLTTGSPRVVQFVARCDTVRGKALARAAQLAAGSAHAFSSAIACFAARALDAPRAVRLAALQSRQLHPTTLPGRGLKASFDHEPQPTLLGSVAWLEDSGLTTEPAVRLAIDRALAEGQSLSAVGFDGRVQGVFIISEALRCEAAAALSACAAQGCQVAVLTGDHSARGEALARELGIEVMAGLSPEDKLTAIGRAQASFGPVAMIGDGVNDAPALETADVGIALGCGADISRESASVCLLGNDLRRIPWAIKLARRSVRIIRQNLFWTFGYNVVGLALAAVGRLNPGWAALAMVLSSTFVVANSLRISREFMPDDGARHGTIDPQIPLDPSNADARAAGPSKLTLSTATAEELEHAAN